MQRRRKADRLMVDRRRVSIWAISAALGVVVLIASLELVRGRSFDPWTWLADVWGLIAAIPAPYVILACALKATEVSLNAAAWLVVLNAAYPKEDVAFRQTLGVVQ